MAPIAYAMAAPVISRLSIARLPETAHQPLY
jgi:hypothetical protein